MVRSCIEYQNWRTDRDDCFEAFRRGAEDIVRRQERVLPPKIKELHVRMATAEFESSRVSGLEASDAPPSVLEPAEEALRAARSAVSRCHRELELDEIVWSDNAALELDACLFRADERWRGSPGCAPSTSERREAVRVNDPLRRQECIDLAEKEMSELRSRIVRSFTAEANLAGELSKMLSDAHAKAASSRNSADKASESPEKALAEFEFALALEVAASLQRALSRLRVDEGAFSVLFSSQGYRAARACLSGVPVNAAT
jgi:hypothetical protein